MSETMLASLLATHLQPCGPVVGVACSGGPDSTALLRLALAWAAATGRSVRVWHVDHALRPESAAEAATLQKIWAVRGVTIEIVRWQHAGVTSAVHERARAARYDLLAQAAATAGVQDLLLAHHGDDQAETVLMRLLQGSGVDGLAGMQSPQDYTSELGHKLRLWRPLLSVPKAALVADCLQHQLEYVTDPSNAALHFRRGQLRAAASTLAALGLTQAHLLTLQTRMQSARAALQALAQAEWDKLAAVHPDGTVALPRAALVALPTELQDRLLLQALAVVAPTAKRPKFLQRQAALAWLADGPVRGQQDGKNCRRTLGGCWLFARQRTLVVAREPAACAVLPLPPAGTAAEVMWDGRWQVSLPASYPVGAVLRPLGLVSAAELARLMPDLPRTMPSALVRASLPTLWQAGQLLALPPAQFLPHLRPPTAGTHPIAVGHK